jgi:hypothetical protein
MQSDLFGNAKISASVGRKTASRAQMRRLLIEQSAARVDNRQGRKRRSTEEEQDQEQINNRQSVHIPTVLRSSFDSKEVLATTLQYLNANSLKGNGKRMRR